MSVGANFFPVPQANPGANEMSPGVGAAFGGALFDGERLPYRTQHALSPDKDHYYAQDQGRPRPWLPQMLR